MRSNKKVKIDWGLVLLEVDQAVKYFEDQEVKPTLRTLFYYLYSKNLIPNTKKAYKYLSKVLVKARKDKRYPWDFMEDRTRSTLGILEDERYQDEILDYFKGDMGDKFDMLDLDNIIDDYFDYLLPEFHVGKWADQPIGVEIWIEKEALVSIIEGWIKNWLIPIRINKGYSSWTFIYNNVQSLEEELNNHEKIHILYMGDLDYSGVDIQRFLEEALEYFNMDSNKVKLDRLAVTYEQVEKLGLPPKPKDKKTLKRLEKDSRKNNYDLKYIIELDSLLAYVPGEFKKLIIDAIKSRWDEDLYRDLKNKAKDLKNEAKEFLEDIKEQAREKLMGVINED